MRTRRRRRRQRAASLSRAALRADCNADEDKEQFEYQLRISPLHNVPSDKPLPSLLVLTSDHDDRVVPGPHSFKFVAEVQHTAGPHTDKPLLMRLERKGGHGAGLPLRKQLEATADALVFVANAIGIEWQD